MTQSNHRLARDICTHAQNPQPSPPLIQSLVVGLAMVSIGVVLVLEEQVLVAAVSRKGDSRNAQTGEAVLESVPSCKGALVSPGLAIVRVSYFGTRDQVGGFPLLTFAPRDRIGAGQLIP